jgi:hypothetical protein
MDASFKYRSMGKLVCTAVSEREMVRYALHTKQMPAG